MDTKPPVVPVIPSWGEVVEKTPPTRQNQCLVSERFTESMAESPQDYAPTGETKNTPLAEDTGKTPPTGQVEDVPVDGKEPAPITPVEDDVVELHMGMEDLD